MANKDSKELFDLVNNLIDQKTTKEIVLGTIDPDYVSGDPRIVFDGERVPSAKQYKKLSSYDCKAKDRVVLVRIGRSYVILGSLG